MAFVRTSRTSMNAIRGSISSEDRRSLIIIFRKCVLILLRSQK